MTNPTGLPWGPNRVSGVRIQRLTAWTVVWSTERQVDFIHTIVKILWTHENVWQPNLTLKTILNALSLDEKNAGLFKPLEPLVTIRTTSLTYNSTFCPHSVFMCFVWIWEQTAIISLYSINWLVFITETECLLRGTDWIFISSQVNLSL